MSACEIALHGVASIEVKPVKHLLLSSAGNTFPVQHVYINLKDGSQYELTLFLEDTYIGLEPYE